MAKVPLVAVTNASPQLVIKCALLLVLDEERECIRVFRTARPWKNLVAVRFRDTPPPPQALLQDILCNASTFFVDKLLGEALRFVGKRPRALGLALRGKPGCKVFCQGLQH